jgi:hypothetical protein
MRDTRGIIKMVADAETDKVLGTAMDDEWPWSGYGSPKRS